MDMKYNRSMLAYDVRFSALMFIISGGAPVQEYVMGPSQEEKMAYLEMLDRMREDRHDGF